MASSRDQIAFNDGRDRFSASRVLDAVHDPLIVIDASDPHLRILFANAAARQRFDYFGAALVGASLARLLDAPSAASLIGMASGLPARGIQPLSGLRWTVAGVDLPDRIELCALEATDAPRMVMLTLPAGEPIRGDIGERERLEHEVLEASTREQERIAQDLHDGLGQELTGIALMLRGLSSKIRRDHPSASVDVEEIVALVNRSIESARSLARGLSPVSVGRGGVIQALRSLAMKSRELYGLNVRFRSKVWPQLTLDDTSGDHLYRIAQEALTNVARHARATQVDCRLHVAHDKFSLSIEDDGIGIDRSLRTDSGMGLRLMKYRAGKMAATLEILSNEPSGTIVRISGEQPLVM